MGRSYSDWIGDGNMGTRVLVFSGELKLDLRRDRINFYKCLWHIQCIKLEAQSRTDTILNVSLPRNSN